MGFFLYLRDPLIALYKLTILKYLDKGTEFLPQTMNSVRSNNLSLKYQRCIPSVCNDMI